MRNRFDEQLKTLNRGLTAMGAMCEEAIALSSKALTTKDRDLAKKVSGIESEIDRMEHSIETLCLRLILQQQPVAKDLRQVSTALKMITDMERIGDQAADIAEIVSYLDFAAVDNFDLLGKMAELTVKMVTESVDAFVKKDVKIAKNAIKHDDGVDKCFSEIKSSLIKMIAEGVSDGEYALDILMIAKYYERIGDHAVNIAEWVVYSVTGNHKGENI